jgi:hypothetical protein
MMPAPHATALLALLAFAATAGAQANAVPGIDLRLSNMRTLEVLARQGAFPDGLNALAIETTVCNDGTLEVEWHQPMNEHHPKIGFLIAALRDGRIVQVSNRSYVKHGFFALNGRACGPCEAPTVFGEYLGVGCSDTYSTDNNGDNFYLGPPEEIDPWLGTWERRCSLFDRGFPAVGLPEECNGLRSLSRTGAGALGPLNSRVQVSDAELAAGELFYQGHYVVEGQPDAGRDNSVGSRPFTASWNGTRWSLAPSGSQLDGTVLQRWPDATIGSATNGDDDGRVFVAVKVTGPVEGFWRYEYALHNRDNWGGIGGLRIPVCASARVRAVGSRDIDQDPLDDWSAGVRGDELLFACRGEPVAWNTIHNFWFECDAAPAAAELVLEQFKVRSGSAEFAVASVGPGVVPAVHLGPGCALGAAPNLYPYGSPAQAVLGNASFGLGSSGNAPLAPHVLLFGLHPGVSQIQGCTLWISGAGVAAASTVLSGPDGVAAHPLPVPASLALEGKVFRLQGLGRDPAGGPLFSRFELTDAVMIRLGDAVPACP